MYDMGTTWYFDGSGTGPESPVMVLSGLGGTDEVWRAFDSDWRDALLGLGIGVWHSTDRFRRQTADPGPTLPDALLNIIGKQISAEFNAVSFAVDKPAADALRSVHHEKIPLSEKILMDECFSSVGIGKADTGHMNRVSLIFDKGEPFIHHLKGPWQRGRTELRTADENGWPRQVRAIEPANTKDHPGLQAADLLSWAIRSRYQYGDRLVDPKTFLIMFPFAAAGKLRGGYFDEKAIRSRYIEKRAYSLRHNYSFI